jgi:hypothetical protein
LCGDSIPGPLLLARWEKCITQSLDVIRKRREEQNQKEKNEAEHGTLCQPVYKKERARERRA